MEDLLLSEMVKRAGKENAAMVEPVGRTDAPSQNNGPGKAAQLAFLAGLGADVGTTAYGNWKGLTEEANPALKWAGKAAAPVAAGMGLGTLLLSRMLSKNHPKIAKALLYGSGGMHGAAALYNVGQIKQANANRSQPGPPNPGMLKAPDGSWYDPSFFPGGVK